MALKLVQNHGRQMLGSHFNRNMRLASITTKASNLKGESIDQKESEPVDPFVSLVKNGWSKVSNGQAIEKSFEFKNFMAAWGFMNFIAIESEKKNHHPEWSNVYGKVNIKWTTHSEGGLTLKDSRLARICDKHSKFFSQ